jgi:hypothetical protein
MLAPGGAERRRLCSLVVPSRAASAVAKELAKQGAEVPIGRWGGGSTKKMELTMQSSGKFEELTWAKSGELSRKMRV